MGTYGISDLLDWWEEGDAGGRHVGEESRLSTGREDATSSMPVARVLPAAQQDIPSINSQRLPVFVFRFRFVFVLSGRQDILSVNSALGSPLHALFRPTSSEEGAQT